MGEIQCPENADHDVTDLFDTETPVLYEVFRERYALHELHDDIVAFRILVILVNTHDVRMVEPPGSLGLAYKALLNIMALQHQGIVANSFDRHIPLYDRIQSLVHPPHCTFTEDAYDLVLPIFSTLEAIIFYLSGKYRCCSHIKG
jgi:hypothetical protein